MTETSFVELMHITDEAGITSLMNVAEVTVTDHAGAEIVPFAQQRLLTITDAAEWLQARGLPITAFGLHLLITRNELPAHTRGWRRFIALADLERLRRERSDEPAPARCEHHASRIIS